MFMIPIEQRKLIIRWHNEGKNQQDIADLVGCHQTSVGRLISKYKNKKTVKNLVRTGRPTVLNENVKSSLKKKIENRIRVANDSFNSVSTKEIKNLIADELGVVYSMRHVERIMHGLKFSLITPRTTHIRHNQEKVDEFRDEFKKKLKKSMWIMK